MTNFDGPQPDTGQRPDSPEARFADSPHHASRGEQLTGRPLMSPDSVLADDLQQSDRVGNGASWQDEGREDHVRTTASGGSPAEPSGEKGGSQTTSNGNRRGSFRDAPSSGNEHVENSSSGSGTNRNIQRLALTYSGLMPSKKRPAWQIDLSEVDLGDLIASGAFGSVHKGVYQGREVAVKLLHIPESSSEKEKRAVLHAFKQEVSVWYQLHHPNIVEFIGASMEAKQWAIVTEFIAGGSLKSFTAQRKGKRLPLHQAINMALDVARGMAYLHNKDILHRDLKSANLLIDPAYHVKVADFGLARQEAADPGDMTCETGTIRWMAPEVIDHRPYTRKVDVYSFSIVAWEIFTMKLPFEGYTFVQLAHAVVANNARPPMAGIPKPVFDILERCWDPLPERRPDLNTVVKWLEDLLGDGVSDLKEEAKAGGCSCTIL